MLGEAMRTVTKPFSRLLVLNARGLPSRRPTVRTLLTVYGSREIDRQNELTQCVLIEGFGFYGSYKTHLLPSDSPNTDGIHLQNPQQARFVRVNFLWGRLHLDQTEAPGARQSVTCGPAMDQHREPREGRTWPGSPTSPSSTSPLSVPSTGFRSRLGLGNENARK
ncbi:hypothetical protein HPP92_004843 [Vanilla planifolia]|uniref:Uncharacterized protein n=1 Tax=Vanilla planifolia TaxID=51239 RepID=A0A835RNH3_VANPL|nr:hypothetical protein HPP92_004843 [Vanilla planifolia]